jgi:hypothetical protein
MIVTSSSSTVDSNVSSKSFSFKNSAKGFKIIANNLYSCKPSAVLREIGQNCVDSHIAAGKKSRPFTVKLPNYSDTNLVFRDYGTSMSHEFMMTRYTVAFDSTKDETNKQNGAWGIGRLSPLTLSDKYTVNCFSDQTKRSYSIFYNCGEVPEITYLGESPTTDEDGVEVIVNIPREYIYSFGEKVSNVFRFFNPKPSIEGMVIPEIKYLIEGNNYGFIGQGQSFAVMGCYGYPIEPSKITDLSENEKRILSAGILLNIKIGELDVNASREGLSYSEKTVQCIREKLSDISVDLRDKIIARFDNCKTIWEVKTLFGKLCSRYGDLHSLEEFIKNSDLKWRGRKIDSSTVDLLEFSLVKDGYVSFSLCNLTEKKPTRHPIDKISTLHTINLVFNDLDITKNLFWRIRENCVLINGKKGDVDTLLKEVGIDASLVEKISDFEELKPDFGLTEYAKTKIFQYVSDSSHFNYGWQQLTTKLSDISGFYVIIERKQIWCNNLNSCIGFGSIVNNYRAASNDKTPIYGIKRSEEKKVAKAGLIKFSEHLQKYALSLIAGKEDIYLNYQNFHRYENELIRFICKNADKLPSLSEILKPLIEISQYKGFPSETVYLINATGAKVQGNILDFNYYKNYLLNRYPMLKYHNRVSFGDKDLVDYIHTCEKALTEQRVTVNV